MLWKKRTEHDLSYSLRWDTTRRADAHRRIHRSTLPPSLPDTLSGLTGKCRGPPSDVGAASEGTGSNSALDMEEIDLLSTAITPARQVNSLRVELQYSTSGALFSALYRAVQISPSGFYYRPRCGYKGSTKELSSTHARLSQILCNG